MKKRKHYKFKRLILRIVSVISIISILISSVVLFVSADSLDIPYDGYHSNLLRLYKNWSMNDDGSGSYGDIVYTSEYRINSNSDLASDYLKKPFFMVSPSSPAYPNGTTLNGNLALFSYRLYSPLNLEAGIYTISFRFGIGQISTSSWLSSGGTLDVLSLSLVDNPNNLWFTKWYDVNYSVSYEGYCNVTVKLPITQSANITHFRFGLVFRNLKFGGSDALYNSRMEFVIFDSIKLSYQPIYVMPDFSEQDNNQALEDGIRENGGDAFVQLDNFYKSLGNLRDSFDYIKKSMFRSTFIFSVLFTDGGLFTDILYFSLVIGLSGFIIGVIGSVASWGASFSSREFNKHNRR